MADAVKVMNSKRVLVDNKKKQIEKLRADLEKASADLAELEKQAEEATQLVGIKKKEGRSIQNEGC